MSQEYIPVTWVDETPNTPGTVINKARLDQMQTAHHFADGFEEVDAVPTTDPGVDYHKVVYCTADSTFYRWDGLQWTKDIDDDTKQLLLDHEADHNNPHVVTKAQVGLGNVDNTSDADKPVSDAMQSALDDKLDDSQLVSAWQGTPDNDHIPTEKLVKDSLDGKVPMTLKTIGVWFYAQTSSGTVQYQGTSGATGGITSVPMRDSSGRIRTAAPSANDDAANKKYVDDLGALKLDDTQLVTSWGGTPSDSNIPSEKLVKDSLDTKADTATTLAGYGITDAVDLNSAQTIAGPKTFTSVLSVFYNTPTLNIKTSKHTAGTAPGSASNSYLSFKDNGDYELGLVTSQYSTSKNVRMSLMAINEHGNMTFDRAELNVFNNNDGTKYATAPSRTYNASNTSDVVTIGSLQASTDVVHTTGNETIRGIKTFQRGAGFTKVELKAATGQTGPICGLNYLDSSGNTLSQIYNTDAGELCLYAYAGTDKCVTLLGQRAYNASNTNDIATIGTLDAYTPMVRTTGNQTITGEKTFSGGLSFSNLNIGTSRASGYIGGINFRNASNVTVAQLNAHLDGSFALYPVLGTNCSAQVTNQRAYSPANTDDIATIGTLDAYTPMVRTTGNQEIGGNKTFTGVTSFSANTWMRMFLQNNAVKVSQADSPDHSFDIRFVDVDGNAVGLLQFVCGSSSRFFRIGINDLNGNTTWTTLASVTL